MTDFFVELRGYNRVRNGLRWLAVQAPREVDQEVGRFARGLRDTLKGTAYPPERPGQTYVRTGRLANSWSAVRAAEGRWLIRNSAPYSGYVVGREQQAWMHRGRWWIAENVIQREVEETLTPALTKLLQEGAEGRE